MLLIGMLLALQDPRPFRMTVDGREWEPRWISLRSEDRGPSEGDLLDGPENLWIPLGPERELRLRGGGEGDGRIFVEREGKTSPIGAHVGWSWGPDRKILFHNPLEKMSGEELRGIRAVALNFWSDDVIRSLRRLDGSRLGVSLRLMAPMQAHADFPALPEGLRYLRVWDGNQHLQAFDAIAFLKDLRVLDLDVSSPFDVRLLGDLRRLEWLRLSGSELQNLDAIGRLSGLRFLTLSWRKSLSDLSFAKDLHALEVLDIERTAVADLRPLGGLKKLRVVRADGSAVKILPEGELPALRELRVMSTAVGDAEAAAFAKANPRCRVALRWNEALLSALQGVTRLRVREGGLCHRQGGEKVMFETKDAGLIGAFSALLEIDEGRSDFHCMCCGEPTLEFYEGDVLKVEIGFHHGQSIRWRGWPGDGALTPEAADGLIRLLAANNVPGPLRAREAAEEAARAEERQIARALAGLGPAVLEAYRTDENAFAEALKKARPEPRARAEALLRMLGTSTDSWWTEEPLEQRARKLLSDVPVEDLKAVVEAALAGGERIARRGAARFWVVGDSPLKDWRPAADSPAREAVLAAQQEARYYPHRQEALKNLVRWQSTLPKAVVDRRLRAGLLDPEIAVRRVALLTAGKLGHAGSAAHLMEVLAGKAVEPLPLPPVPADEERPKDERPYDTVVARPEAEYAALGLGYLGHAPARAVLASRAEDSPAYAVALAMLGEPERLVRAHFDGSSSDTELQVAAVEAVVRGKGRVALAETLDYQQARFWWEPELVVERLKDMLLREDAAGRDALEKAKSLEDLKAWHKTHGASYAERFRR